MKNNWISIIVFFFVILFIYTKIAGPIPFSVNSVQTNKNDLFTTSGTGKATAIPDIATVSIGVTQKGTAVSEVQEKINQTAKGVIDALGKLGIEEKYIETINYNVYPNYDFSNRQKITDYSATQSIEIKVKDIQKINQVIDAATSNGANIIGSVNFTFSDELKLELEEKARKQAVEKAKDKAESLAKVSGIKLGKLINVTEDNSEPPRLFTTGIGGLKEDEEASTTNITPGEGTVNITVTLYYETY